MTRGINKLLFLTIVTLVSIGLAVRAGAVDKEDLQKEIQELRQQNQLLQDQLHEQKQMIEDLSHKFSDLARTNVQQEGNITALKTAIDGADHPTGPTLPSLGNVVITGEGAAGFFDTGKNGSYPNAPFRVDEARLFFDAPIWDDVYFYAEADLVTPESSEQGLYLGELYVQAENLAKHWNLDSLLNARIGQFYVPFGEEYQRRFAFDNPLITHSLSDLWGLDAGVELYGSWKKFSYAAAVQNGGISTMNDGNADKSVAGRIGYDPYSWLHLSLSGMRTGNISASEDHVTSMWFGGGLFRSIGAPNTSLFHVNLAEFDATARWKNGYLSLAGGYAGYDDNGTGTAGTGDHRDIYYDYLEVLQHVTPKLYGAARFSQIHSAGGYPIVGDTETFGLPTSDLWRLSLGVGYQLSRHLTLKAEYMIEHGELSTGGVRDHENMFAAEAAFKF